MTSPKRYRLGFDSIAINENLCKGCDICIEFCPTNVFQKSEKLNHRGYYVPVVARVEDCTGCRLCDLLCPELAIVISDYQGRAKVRTPAGGDD